MAREGQGRPADRGAIVTWRKRYEIHGAGDLSTHKQNNWSYLSAKVDEYRQGGERHVR